LPDTSRNPNEFSRDENFARSACGSYDIEGLPVGHNYMAYAERFVGLATPGDFSDALNDLCASSNAPACTTPAVNTNFNPRI
jgi:hypothetical protein